MSDSGARAVATLLEVLDPAATGADTFVAQNLPHPTGRVFGGQVLAQVLIAAGRTVPEGRAPHSLHAYFLRPGSLDVPVELEVSRLRDGRSFSSRAVNALQSGLPILSAIASFQADQPGFDNCDPMPALVPSPEQTPSAMDALGHVDDPVARFWSRDASFDLRHVGGSLYLERHEHASGRQLVWMKARAPLPDDPLLHRALLAFACDQVMLEPVLRRSGVSWSHPGLSVASLDHAMWWHRPARVDEWLLYVQSAPSAQGGRGLGAARVYTADGTLVASIAQEGMIRVPDL
ncbi:MAG: acyl-CoA thioesterase II [Actinobacteria bacterium]|nr:acyl-CoA thioesterase II [Actinomycetota bacterium]MCG2801308.1 acyl-CoA thioesterase II [Cellulomonas sp.]